ncbi:MAG: ABC transporter ATP-binding protein [bacterium]|nr:ABC transporter ATP-binding protein [bacterium]
MIGGSTPMHLMWSSQFDPKRPTAAKVDLRRILRFFAPYWRQEALVLLCILITSALGQLPPLFTKWIIDGAIAGKSVHGLIVDAGGMAVSAIAASAIGAWQGYLNAFVGEAIMRDMRDRLVQHLHTMSLAFFTSTKTGEIMNRVSSDVDAVDNVVTGTLVTIATNVAVILTTLVAIFLLDWRLALLSLAVVPLMVVPLRPVGRSMYAIRKRTREQRDRIESLIQETLTLSGITLIKSFVREREEAKRFHEAGTDLMNLEISLAMVGRWFVALVGAMVVVGPAIVWFGGGWLAVKQGLGVGTIVAFVAYLGRLYGPAAALVGVQVQLVSALAVFERIFDYLDMVPEAPQRPDAVRLGSARGAIAFESVAFGYSAQRRALRDVSLRVEPGQLAAFVGPSGAGKTTILQLVPRFYDPQQGRVTLDGYDLRDLRLESLRRNIGIVTQETYLFHATVAENLRYGRPDAGEADLIAACKAANIYGLVESLPDGLQTVVGERGHKLSGGERQRLAIARVLLKDPCILILDEATSSLDSSSERLIQDALEPLMRGRTSLVIAHRLSTILRADVIFVVDGGRIVESGSHDELLARAGLYATLYHQQFRDLDEARNVIG